MPDTYHFQTNRAHLLDSPLDKFFLFGFLFHPSWHWFIACVLYGFFYRPGLHALGRGLVTRQLYNDTLNSYITKYKDYVGIRTKMNAEWQASALTQVW